MSGTTQFRLALATSAAMPDLNDDDRSLLAPLRALGVEPHACIWNDAAVDWSSFDAVLLRSTWDYFERYGEFLAWLDRLDRDRVPTINGSGALRWNSDKRYLLDLAQHGVDIVPTQRVVGSDLDAVAWPADDVVVKPCVSGGAWLTLRGRVDTPEFAAALAGLPRDLEYLVQPYLPEIVDAGEWSLLYFGGRYSHSVLKRAAQGDYRVQSQYGGSADKTEPEPFLRAAAERVLDAVAALGHGDHAYARVDGVVVDGRFLLMEIELIEPLLHLRARDGAAAELAGIVAQRLQALRVSATRAA